MCHGLDGLELHTSMRYLRHGSVELELNPPFKILDPPLVPNPSPTSCWKHSHQEKMQREYKFFKEGDGTPRHCLTVGWNSLETTLDSLIALQWWQLPHAVLIMSLCFTMHTHTHTHTLSIYPCPRHLWILEQSWVSSRTSPIAVNLLEKSLTQNLSYLPLERLHL